MRDGELLGELGGALAPPAIPPSDERIAALRDAVADGNRSTGTPRDANPSGATALRRHWPVLAAAAIVVALVGLVVVNGDDEPAGTVEYAGPIDDDGVTGMLTVTKTGIGRVVELDTADLEILPAGDFYEVWFVGPDDTPDSLDRISAGTFHPDPDGRSQVTFAAAVDPSLYPTVEITAEPGDGDPTPALPALARTDLSN